VSTLGRHLQQARDINLIPYGARFLPQNQDPTTGRPRLDNFFRPYIGYTGINYIENASTSNYDSQQAQANRRFSHGLQFGGAWTWSKTMDFTDTDGGVVATYAPTRIWDYGKARFDRTHVLAVNWRWEAPGGSKLWNTRLSPAALDHWQISGIITLMSGAPPPILLTTVYSADITGGGDKRAAARAVESDFAKERTDDQPVL
jgi:hypothetical protein